MMSKDRIYDIGVDQLKCNFCTNYFQCSMHYANLQRYGLKACPKCFQQFSFTLLHPLHYTIHRIMLIDMGIKIPLQTATQIIKKNNKSMSHGHRSTQLQKLWEQFTKTQEEIHNKITDYFAQQIKKLSDLLQKTRTSFQVKCQQIKQYFEVKQANDNDYEARQNIQALKNFPYDGKEQMIQSTSFYGIKNLKGSIIVTGSNTKKSSNRKASFQEQNKENNKIGHNIRQKIIKGGEMKKSYSKESKGLLSSRSTASLAQSIKTGEQSRKLLESTRLKIFTNSDHQIQRNQVNKLLNNKSSFTTYMPVEMFKDESFMVKNESSRNITESIIEIRQKTLKSGQLIEIIGENISKINFDCYLRSLGDISSVKTLRIIRCSLVDADMDYLLNFISENPYIETLIITNNRLTQNSIEALLTFKQRHQDSRLKNVYIGNNHVNCFKVNNLLKNNQKDDLLIYI